MQSDQKAEPFLARFAEEVIGRTDGRTLITRVKGETTDDSEPDARSVVGGADDPCVARKTAAVEGVDKDRVLIATETTDDVSSGTLAM
jgi:hypothetical protein